MSKITPNYLKPLQGLKTRLIKQVIASLINALFSMQRGNKKPLINLLFLLYFLFYGIYVNIKSAFIFLWPYKIAVTAAVFFYLCIKYVYFSRKAKAEKLKKEAKKEMPEDLWNY